MSDLRSLDFVVNRLFMKLFNTYVIDTIKLSQDYFDFDLPSVIIRYDWKAKEDILARFDTVEKARVSLYAMMY